MKILALVAMTAVATMAQPVSTARLKADLEFLCSDQLAGRVSLSREADISARYIAADFERSGLKTTLQGFPMIGYRSDPSRRQLILHRGSNAKAFESGKDFTGAFSKEVRLAGLPLAFGGYGITAPEYNYDDYANLDARGKIVLIFDHEPQESNPQSVFLGTGHTIHAGRWAKIQNARRHGAVALLIASEPSRDHRGLMEVTPSQRQPNRASAPTQALDDDSLIPAFTISDRALSELLPDAKEHQFRIDAELKPQSTLIKDSSVDLESINAETTRGRSYNVAGLLEGSDPKLRDETILITAHYDHLGVQNGRVYRGANDNASGTVAVMELARLFSVQRPKRSILFLVFGSEEQLMLGSLYYTRNPIRPLASTRAVLNLDMIGRDEAHIPQSEGVLKIAADTSNVLNLVATPYAPALAKTVERENEHVGLTLDTKFDRDHTLNALFRCDHLPFLYEGVPALWLFGGFHPGYHEPSDTVDKLNFGKMEKVIRLAYRVAAAD